MAVKGILFNTEMVRAILDGRKTVTRRVIKFPKNRFNNEFPKSNDIVPCEIKNNKVSFIIESIFIYKVVPLYKPGDILYVRETYCPNYFDESIAGYRGDLRGNRNAYKADFRKEIFGGGVQKPKWRPSIHMPKEAARIWLRVTDVRVERLQEITEEQAKAEGAIDNRGFIHPYDNEYESIHTCREDFIKIWDSTIKKSDLGIYGWEANPWVWVIEFERCDKTKGDGIDETD